MKLPFMQEAFKYVTDQVPLSEDQESKAASHWLLPWPQSENGDLASKKAQNESETESSLFPFYNPL